MRMLLNVFQPDSVIMLSDSDVTRIAAEGADKKEIRRSLQILCAALKQSLCDLGH